MLVQRVQQQFIDSADLGYQCAEALGPAVESAIGALLATLTGGGKVLACGVDSSQLLAQLLVSHFLNGLERERPALPALLLPAASTDMTASAALVRAVTALAASDDLLLLVTDSGAHPALPALIQAAHDRDLTVLALSGTSGGALARLLRDTDVHISVPHTRRTRIHEMHLLVLNCLCDGLDAQLLGDDPPKETLE